MSRYLSLLILFPGLAVIASAQWQITAVVNSASFVNEVPAGGALATVFITGVSATPGTYVAPAGQPLPLSLAGFQVLVDDASAPILAVVVPPEGLSGVTQINFQVPMERNVSFQGAAAGNPVLPLTVTAGTTLGATVAGGATITVNSTVQGQYWGGFFSDGNGNAIALHTSDRSLVTAQNPAHPGEAIIAYADDLFTVWPPPPIAIPLPQGIVPQVERTAMGGPTEPMLLYLQTYPATGMDGQSCANTPALQVTFEGLAQGMLGVDEVDFVVPANQQPGSWALFFNVDSKADGGGCTQVIDGFARSSPYVSLPVSQ